MPDLVYQVDRVIKHQFPGLGGWFASLPEVRKFSHYSLSNLLLQGLFLFICQERSRNAMNNRVEESDCYRENFSRLFRGMKTAHFDTVDEVLRKIEMEDLEKVKVKMIRRLIEKKVLPKCQGYYLVTADATGVTSYDEDLQSVLLHKTSKNGKVTYLNIMLEAKLVTPEGLCLSLASEPLNNEEIAEYNKPDCETKAFKRLAKKIKSLYPRLPICILVDALYANQSLFEICRDNGWQFIVTFKDKQLKTLQTEIIDTIEKARIRFEKQLLVNKEQHRYNIQSYQAIEGLTYLDYQLNWIECIEWQPPTAQPAANKEAPAPVKFVYLTNISLGEITDLKEDRIIKIIKAGRCRWKTENEGFNTQKHLGYHLHHKFARNAVKTLHNYYQLLQMAHIINQLVIHSQTVAQWLKQKSRRTVISLWDMMRAVLGLRLLRQADLDNNEGRYQIRYD